MTWNEQKHPRAADGQFGHGPGGAAEKAVVRSTRRGAAGPTVEKRDVPGRTGPGSAAAWKAGAAKATPAEKERDPFLLGPGDMIKWRGEVLKVNNAFKPRFSERENAYNFALRRKNGGGYPSAYLSAGSGYKVVKSWDA